MENIELKENIMKTVTCKSIDTNLKLDVVPLWKIQKKISIILDLPQQ